MHCPVSKVENFVDFLKTEKYFLYWTLWGIFARCGVHWTEMQKNSLQKQNRVSMSWGSQLASNLRGPCSVNGKKYKKEV